jgi:hypothetical protein
MASGHANRANSRTHGCTDQGCIREKTLANPEPSTDITRRYPHVGFWPKRTTA